MTWKTVEVIDHFPEGASPDFVALFVSPSASILFLSEIYDDLPKNRRLDNLISGNGTLHGLIGKSHIGSLQCFIKIKQNVIVHIYIST